MENIKLILPSIPEDYDKSIEVDGKWFPDFDKYKPLMQIFYIYPLSRNLKNVNISRVIKKEILNQILVLQGDILDNIFLQKLKKCLPEGLCYENICTDSEYEALIKEFNITGA